MASFNTSAIVDTFMQSTTAAEARAALEIVATLESYDFIDPDPMGAVTLSKEDIVGKIVYGAGDISSEIILDDDFDDDDFFYYVGIINNDLMFSFPSGIAFETIGACNVDLGAGLTVPPNVLCLFLFYEGAWRVCALAGSDFTKQDVLVSGTSIKTINGTSLLGSGDLVVSGGSDTLDITTLNAGEDVSYGDWVCLEDDGKWWLADASGTAGSTHMVGRVVTSANADSIVQVRVQGPFSDSGLTVGSGPYYLSPTIPGAMTATVPSGVGQVVRVVGYATQSASFYVDPSKVWVEIPQPGTIVNINAQVGTEYDLVLTDLGSIIEMNNADANSVSIPLDADVNFPVGSRIDVMQTGAGKTSVIGDVGVTVNGVVEAGAGETKKECIAVWRGISLYKRGANSWGAMGFFG